MLAVPVVSVSHHQCVHIVHAGFGGALASEELSTPLAPAVMPAAPLQSRFPPEASPLAAGAFGAHFTLHSSRESL